MRNGLVGVRQGLLGVALLALPWLVTSGCGDDDKPPPLITTSGGTGGRPEGGITGGTSGDASLDAPGDGQDAAGAGGDATGGTAGDASDASPDGGNCGDIVCRGHGKCIVVNRTPTCICDPGYVLQGDTCVVDEKCIRLRHLEDGCRQLIAGPPSVATFFAVDYCAGTAVLPEKLGDLSTAFKILENGASLSQESYATVIPRDVENYVTIAVDVSKSLTDNAGLLSQLGSELITFVRSLAPAAGEAPVGVSVLVFGRFVAEYVPFTTNLQTVEQKLLELQASPQTAQQLVGGEGTALYDGAKKAIRATERIQRLRASVSDAGVLTTGVAVIVTDGRDTSNATLDKTLIEQTLVNVISIGISNEIDDVYLSAIGRDGSFLAPTTADMAQAFAEITQRVKEYPERAYLMGYCSSATFGTPTVEVTLGQRIIETGVTVQRTAACKFNADIFGSDPLATCDNAEFFSNSCANTECGGFLACGACGSPDQCCAGGSCRAPSEVASGLRTTDCRQQNELCQADDKVCVGTNPGTCEAPLELDAVCSTATDLCDPGTLYCDDTLRQCKPVTKANGAFCLVGTGTTARPNAELCPELNCSRPTAASVELPTCRPQARMFDMCGPAQDADVVCEPGSSCRSNICQPRYPIRNCTSNLECTSGWCDTANSKVCETTFACYFDWADKMQF